MVPFDIYMHSVLIITWKQVRKFPVCKVLPAVSESFGVTEIFLPGVKLKFRGQSFCLNMWMPEVVVKSVMKEGVFTVSLVILVLQW